MLSRKPKKRTGARALPLAIVLLLVHLPLAAQQSEAKTDPWAAFRLLEGTWQGAIDGVLGQGVGERRYEWVMDDHYLIQHHSSVRQPQEKSPRGDHHREIAIYSIDNEDRRLVDRSSLGWGVARCRLRLRSRPLGLALAGTRRAGLSNGRGIRL